jgi:hypothetical protein
VGSGPGQLGCGHLVAERLLHAALGQPGAQRLADPGGPGGGPAAPDRQPVDVGDRVVLGLGAGQQGGQQLRAGEGGDGGLGSVRRVPDGTQGRHLSTVTPSRNPG